MKLATSNRHVSGHCWKDFQGQRSKVKVIIAISSAVLHTLPQCDVEAWLACFYKDSLLICFDELGAFALIIYRGAHYWETRRLYLRLREIRGRGRLPLPQTSLVLLRLKLKPGILL